MFNMFCLLQSPPFNVVSGDAEGVLRLWDLHTGTCLHKVKVHEATVVALTSTPRYMVTSGLDDRLCIVDRKRGTLVHELDMVMLTDIYYTINLSCRNPFKVVWWGTFNSFTKAAVHAPYCSFAGQIDIVCQRFSWYIFWMVQIKQLFLHCTRAVMQ